MPPPSRHKKRSHPTTSSSSPSYPVYNPSSHPQHLPQHEARTPSPPPSSGFSIQAYEVSLIRGRAEEGREMETRRVEGSAGARGRLFKWERDGGGGEDERDVWVDRFSHLHLLPSLPLPSHNQPPIPGSPTLSNGWSDLPSDTEDTFFFSEDEAEDYERDKKRRRLEGLRGGRLAALGGDVVEEPEEEEEEGKKDEEIPPPSILTLMRHTSTSLLSSPSPRVLELRILANHGADPRFAFMRGRWKNVWDGLLAGKTVTAEGVVLEPVEKEKEVVGMAGLMGGYGSDSDSESEEEKEEGAGEGDEGEGETKEVVVELEPVVEVLEETEEEKEKKKRRKEKALEWARKRKEAEAEAERGLGAASTLSSSVPPPPPALDS
ncbi:hypothetical protein BDY24DRAFT_414361 [Mrakia frigida]|uniref:uncharacterized protein n=1 Tax=Mrakia frigida TaxID=29902 RepID=UPI003FCBF8A4